MGHPRNPLNNMRGTVGAGLALLRTTLGVSQVDLATEMGVVQSRVSAIEGSVNLTTDVLASYLRGLGARQLVFTAVFDESRFAGQDGEQPSGETARFDFAIHDLNQGG